MSESDESVKYEPLAVIRAERLSFSSPLLLQRCAPTNGNPLKVNASEYLFSSRISERGGTQTHSPRRICRPSENVNCFSACLRTPAKPTSANASPDNGCYNGLTALKDTESSGFLEETVEQQRDFTWDSLQCFKVGVFQLRAERCYVLFMFIQV